MRERTSKDVLTVNGLRLRIPTYEGTARILNGVNLTLARGEILGLVGETGSGKTMTALAVTGLLDSPPAQITAREIRFLDKDLLHLTDAELREIRARRIAMVFQDPTTNLMPVLSVGEQMIDTVMCRQGRGSPLSLSLAGRLLPGSRRNRRVARTVALEMLHRVGISHPKERLGSYPHELSGGMKQRVLIAMALAGDPEILIADEPTTALDVSIEAQILKLVRELVDELDLSVLWVTHNLGVVWKLCTQVAVMYSGAVVERASTERLFAEPLHPYTTGLLKAIPAGQKAAGRLVAIPGTPPNPVVLPSGCRFHPRCPLSRDVCTEVEPELRLVHPGHQVACHLVQPEVGEQQSEIEQA